MEENSEVQEIETKRRLSVRRSINFADNRKFYSINEEWRNKSISAGTCSNDYLDTLLREERDWIKEYKERRSELKQSKLALNSIQENDQNSNLSILSEKQRNFLNNKIDFLKMVDLIEETKLNSIKLMAATEKANHLQTITSNLSKEKVQTIKRHCINKLF